MKQKRDKINICFDEINENIFNFRDMKNFWSLIKVYTESGLEFGKTSGFLADFPGFSKNL
jgi:hypothetical protein